MTADLAEQNVLRTIQSITRTMMGLQPLPLPARRVREAAAVKQIRIRLLEVGDLFLDALRLEGEFAGIDLSEAPEEELERWRECRTCVERLAEDYLSLIAEWRGAMEAGCRLNRQEGLVH
jgi:hypothetical protein